MRTPSSCQSLEHSPSEWNLCLVRFHSFSGKISLRSARADAVKTDMSYKRIQADYYDLAGQAGWSFSCKCLLKPSLLPTCNAYGHWRREILQSIRRPLWMVFKDSVKVERKLSFIGEEENEIYLRP